MASKTEILNLAIELVGSSAVLTPTDNKKQATRANRVYDPTRMAVLRGHPWNFALERAELAQISVPPAFGFAQNYQLPGDCLRVLAMDDPEIKWVVEGRKLLTDEATANIHYVRDVVDTGAFDALYIDALATYIASKITFPLARNRALAADLRRAFFDQLALARVVDAQEGGGQEGFTASTWENARL